MLIGHLYVVCLAKTIMVKMTMLLYFAQLEKSHECKKHYSPSHFDKKHH